ASREEGRPDEDREGGRNEARTRASHDETTSHSSSLGLSRRSIPKILRLVILRFESITAPGLRSHPALGTCRPRRASDEPALSPGRGADAMVGDSTRDDAVMSSNLNSVESIHRRSISNRLSDVRRAPAPWRAVVDSGKRPVAAGRRIRVRYVRG